MNCDTKKSKDTNHNNSSSNSNCKDDTTPACCPSSSSSSSNKGHKRPRKEVSALPKVSVHPPRNIQQNPHHDSSPSWEASLAFYTMSRSWLQVTQRAQTHPQEAQYGCSSSGNKTPVNLKLNPSLANSSSPLAIACRYGAPPETVEAILEAEKSMVRRCIPNRGTPLHEAIMAYPNLEGTNKMGISTTDDRRNANSPIACNDTSWTPGLRDGYHFYRPYVEVIRLLLRADEQLEHKEESYCDYNQTRATLLQDVDGNVPLHLLVRQAFYNYIGGMSTHVQQPSPPSESTTSRNDDRHKQQQQQQQHPLLSIIYDVIESSPEACAMPDFTEFEETPLVLVLKSSIYANEQHSQTQLQTFEDASPNSELNYNSEFEWRIFELCKIMLDKNPYAASFAASKSKHTAVHSAVFHGRCCDTIRLLLKADSLHREQMEANMEIDNAKENQLHDIPPPAAMRPNRFGETPLHFAAMRGECTRTIKLLSQEAPWAALKRDIKYGMTPLHWLSVRFVDVMFERFRHRSFQVPEASQNFDHDIDFSQCYIHDHHDFYKSDDVLSLLTDMSESGGSTQNDSASSCRIENNQEGIEFDFEYHRRTGAIDPPVNYMRMRHILPEHDQFKHLLMNRVSSVLMRVRERHWKLIESIKNVAAQDHHQKRNPNDGETVGDHSEDHRGSGSIFGNRNQCPFSKDMSHTRDVPSPYPSSMTDAQRIQCPASTLRLDSESFTDHFVPHRQDQHEQMHRTDHVAAERKKCPFRCPFVFDSYPIASSVITLEQKDAVVEEQVISLFWAKVTSLIHAAASTKVSNQEIGHLNTKCPVDEYSREYMLHTACSSPCPFEIVRLILNLYPEQLHIQDTYGKLPLHHAASRKWNPREFDKILVANNTMMNSSNLIHEESAKALRLIIQESSKTAMNVCDCENRLPFHHAIDSMVQAVVDYPFREQQPRHHENPEANDATLFSVIELLRLMISISPETVEKRDGKTGLFPFMQVVSTASERLGKYHKQKRSNSITISLTYCLLLENPSLAVTYGMVN